MYSSSCYGSSSIKFNKLNDMSIKELIINIKMMNTIILEILIGNNRIIIILSYTLIKKFKC